MITGVAVWFAYQNRQLKQEQALFNQPSPTPTTVLNATSANLPISWQASVLGRLSFQYPSDWQIKVTNPGKQLIIKPISGSDIDISIYTIDNPQDLSLSEFGSDWEMKPNLYSPTAEARIVSGITGYYQENQHCEPSLCDKLAVSYQQKIYVVTIAYQGIDSADINQRVQTYRPIFQQVILSLKFVGQAEISSNKESLLQVVDGYLSALMKGDVGMATNFLAEEVKDETFANWYQGYEKYKTYEVLNKFHSAQEEIDFYNQDQVTLTVKLYEDNDREGNKAQLTFRKADGNWKTLTWYLFP